MKKTIITLFAVIATTTATAMDYDMNAQEWCREVTMGWNLGLLISFCLSLLISFDRIFIRISGNSSEKLNTGCR